MIVNGQPAMVTIDELMTVAAYEDPDVYGAPEFAVGSRVTINAGALNGFVGVCRNVPDKGPITVELQGSALRFKISACYLR